MSDIRALSEADLDAFVELRRLAFPGSGLGEAHLREILAKRLTHSTGLFTGGELACVANVYPTSMNFAGRQVAMGALAGVASFPESRRRGLIRSLLGHLLAVMHSGGVGWCLEYPFDPRFYHRLGWQSLSSGIELELPSELLFSGPPPSARRVPVDDFASLASTYAAWASRYSFTLTRVDDPRDPWKRLTGKPWLDEVPHLYSLEDAYVLFTLSREKGQELLNVEDYAYSSAEGRRNLFAFIGSLHGQVERVWLHLPADEPLALDFGSQYGKAGHAPLQARVVDLAAALRPLTAELSYAVTVRVRDELCEWNDGVFQLESGPEGTSLSPAGSAPTVEIPIQTLPLLLAGALTPAAALAQGLAFGDAAGLAAIAALGGYRTAFMPRSDAF